MLNLAQQLNRFYNDLRQPDVNRIGIALAKEWFDEAERIVNKRSKQIYGSEIQTSVAGQRLYDYPSDILDYQIDSVYYSDTDSTERKILTPITIDELDANDRRWREWTGVPKYWYHDKANGQWGLNEYEANVATGTDCIEIRYKKKHTKMTNYYATGTVSITTATTAAVGGSTAWIGNVDAGDYIGIGKLLDSSTAFPTNWFEIESVDADTGITLADTFTDATATAASYIIASPSSITNDELNMCSVLWAMGLGYKFDQKFELMKMVQDECITRITEETFGLLHDAQAKRISTPFGMMPFSRGNPSWDYGRG